MIHCQNCTVRNDANRLFCWKCGTKLLIASRWAPPDRAAGAMSFMDEHVLERISTTETALTTLEKRIDALAETVERVAAHNFIDHTMIETLTESLETAGLNLSSLDAAWRRKIDSRLAENEEADRLSRRMERIVGAYRGAHREQFTLWMERAYELMASERPAESLDSFEAAFAQDPSNHELGMLLAEVFFHAKDYAAAGKCLTRVLDARPEDFEATLLMGVLEKIRGRHAKAQALLERAVGLRDDSYSAHAALGALFMEADNRARAGFHLNRALELKPSAPTHFMLGALYYQDGRQRRAVKHLEEATELDPEFSEAFYHLGLACQELNWSRRARECFKRAQGLNPREARYRATRRARSGQPRSGGRVSPDPLSGMVRDELCLTTRWDLKRSE